MSQIQITWQRNGHVYGGQSLTIGAGVVVSEAAPDFGGLPGQAVVTVLQGAVFLTKGATVTTETGDYLRDLQGVRKTLTLRSGETIAFLAADAGATSIDGGGYPYGASALQSSSGNKAAAAATATLVPAAGQKAYLAGLEVTYAGSTAGGVVELAITGLLGGTRTYSVMAPVGALVPGPPLLVVFDLPLPAAAVDTNIVATLPSLGAGNLAAAVATRGYSL